jgi:ribonucleoside-diphosphate reductase alpha chain
MLVIKRDGSTEKVSFDKVLRRVDKLSQDLMINGTEIAQKVCSLIYDGVKTSELDDLTAQLCSSLIAEHPDYGTLAARITVSNHQKKTSPSFSETMETLYMNELIHEETYNVTMQHKEKFNTYIDYDRDYVFDYFGFKTLERAYLMKCKGKIIERPQHMIMRVAIGIHGYDVKEVLETYDAISQKYFIHATPTLFNFGTPRPQGSSCFLMHANDDSITGIFDSIKEAALISKYAGGIGMHIHNIRGKNSYIRGTNGNSDGIIPMLRVFNATARYVNQCFTPDTMIVTKDGSKQICDITPNDCVITKDGSFKKVNEIIKNSIDKDILEVRTTHSFEPIHMTKEHEVYVIKSQDKGLNFNVIKNRLHKKFIEPVFITAKDLGCNDLIGYPKFQYNKTNMDKQSGDYYRFIGIMLGDGHICKNRNEAGITLSKTTKLAVYEFVVGYLDFCNIHYWETNHPGCISVGFTNKLVKREAIYDSNNEKIICPEFFDLNYENTLQLVKGLIETDGSIGKEIYFSTTSYNLAHGIRYLLYKLDVLSSGYIKNTVGETHFIRENEQIVTKKICYTIRIPKVHSLKPIFPNIECSDYVKYFEHDNILWTRVKTINTTYYKGDVYDLNIMDNHNYVVSNFGLVHNSGKRNGSIAIYLEPWHSDIEGFMDMRKNHGNEEERARDLFYALWIPDLFMERVKNNEKWSLMCPDTCKGLSDVYGDEFKALYEDYESKGMYIKQVEAQYIWRKILESQVETGTPYMLYKDAVNRKTNHSNLGTIKSSNLCTEICEYTSPDEIAVCNLASVCIASFVDKEKRTYDFKKLHYYTKIVTKNLNKIIDKNFYPHEKAKHSNIKHRPIGIGVQGLADTFILMRYPFDSQEAKQLNREIFETMYHASLECSMEISRKRMKQFMEDDDKHNETFVNTESPKSVLYRTEDEKNKLTKYLGAYSTYEGSPISKGVYQFDMWGVKVTDLLWDWSTLKKDIEQWGVRNSLLLAPMPTASTSQIMGFNECFEPITSNLYKRKTLAGEFIVINKYLLQDLIELKLWNKDLKDEIIINEGMIGKIDKIPEGIRSLYKTAWELKQKTIIDMAVDRGAFVCQSQSMNLFLESPEYNKMTMMHFYAWQQGLKTGMYYLRTKPKANTQQFTIDPKKKNVNKPSSPPPRQHEEEDGVCESCSA